MFVCIKWILDSQLCGLLWPIAFAIQVYTYIHTFAVHTHSHYLSQTYTYYSITSMCDEMMITYVSYINIYLCVCVHVFTKLECSQVSGSSFSDCIKIWFIWYVCICIVCRLNVSISLSVHLCRSRPAQKHCWPMFCFVILMMICLPDTLSLTIFSDSRESRKQPQLTNQPNQPLP